MDQDETSPWRESCLVEPFDQVLDAEQSPGRETKMRNENTWTVRDGDAYGEAPGTSVFLPLLGHSSLFFQEDEIINERRETFLRSGLIYAHDIIGSI
jgi:hypothetical protein